MNKMIKRVCSVCLMWIVLFGVACVAHAQNSGATAAAAVATIAVKSDASVSISGEGVLRPLHIGEAELKKLARRKVTAKDHDVPAEFEGVLLADVLRLAGVKFGELRGKDLSLYAVIEAADNYRAVFALAELDAAFTDKIVLLVDKRDGKPLSSEEGFYRIVVSDEKKQGRWVRQVTSIRIERAR